MKFLLLVFVFVGCKAGVLHRGYTNPLETAVISDHVPLQQYVSYAEPTPLIYGSPIAEAQIEVRTPPRRKAKQQRKPQPQSVSYQFRTEHIPEESEIREEAPRENLSRKSQNVQQIEIQQFQPIESLQHYHIQPLQTAIHPLENLHLQFEAVEQPQVRKQKVPATRKTSRIQETPRRNQIKSKQVHIPDYSDLSYTTYVTPVIYYYPESVPTQPKGKKPVYQPEEEHLEPEHEEEIEQEENQEVLQGDENQEGIEEDNESEVVVARVEPQQRFRQISNLPKGRKQAQQEVVNYQDPVTAYQAFNSANPALTSYYTKW